MAPARCCQPLIIIFDKKVIKTGRDNPSTHHLHLMLLDRLSAITRPRLPPNLIRTFRLGVVRLSREFCRSCACAAHGPMPYWRSIRLVGLWRFAFLSCLVNYYEFMIALTNTE